MENPYPSPLRYPGGKRAIAHYIKYLLLSNGLRGGDYVEVYAGGASVALSLLYDNYVSNIHLNDYNKQLFLFWQAVLNDTEALIRLIQETPITVETWRQQKATYQNLDENEPTDVAFAFLFLNRTNVSGILNGGIIGGHKQAGNYPIDARYNKNALIERIETIAQHKSRIHIYNQDAAVFIRETLPNIPLNSLVYLDPPYFVKGKKLYDNYYDLEDHIEIRDLVTTAIGQKWIISYDNVVDITRLYEEQRSLAYSLRYSSNEKYEGSEIIFFCPELTIPDIESPAYMNRQQLESLLSQQTKFDF